MFSPWEGSTAPCNLYLATLESPARGWGQFLGASYPTSGTLLSGHQLRLRDSPSPRGGAGLPGCGPSHPADRGGHPHVPAHLLRLYRISPWEHLPPADGEWSGATPWEGPGASSLCFSFLKPFSFFCPLLPPRSVLSPPPCRARPREPRGRPPQDSIPEAAAFTVYVGSGGGVWEKWPVAPQSSLWPWETPAQRSNRLSPLPTCPPTVLPLSHHRVPATAGSWGPGLRLLRQGNSGSHRAYSDVHQREEGKVPACAQPD